MIVLAIFDELEELLKRPHWRHFPFYPLLMHDLSRMKMDQPKWNHYGGRYKAKRAIPRLEFETEVVEGYLLPQLNQSPINDVEVGRERYSLKGFEVGTRVNS